MRHQLHRLIKQMGLGKTRKKEKDIGCEDCKQWNLMGLILQIVSSWLILRYFPCLLIINFSPLLFLQVFIFMAFQNYYILPLFSYNLLLVHKNCLFKFGGGGADVGCGLCSRWAIKTSDKDVVLVFLLLAFSIACASFWCFCC